MKKVILLGLMALALAPQAKAQDYHHGAGIQYNFALFRQSYTNPYVNYDGTTGVSVPGFFYKATFAFDVSNSMNFAVSSYPFFGFFFNSQTGGYLGAELPVLAEMYFGDIDEGAFFAGLGGSAGWYGASGFGSGAVLGPQAELGGQFNFRDRVIGVRATFTYGLNKTKNEDPQTVFTLDRRYAIALGLYYKFG